MDKSSQILVTSGRVLLALYFFVPGLAKLLAPAQQLALMEHHNIPAALPLLYIAGAAQLLGALLLVSNRHVRKICLGFVLYIVVINFCLHDFWHFTGMEGAHELQSFIKNLGILAGLLVLAGMSSVRALQPFTVKNFLRSDSKP